MNKRPRRLNVVKVVERSDVPDCTMHMLEHPPTGYVFVQLQVITKLFPLGIRMAELCAVYEEREHADTQSKASVA